MRGSALLCLAILALYGCAPVAPSRDVSSGPAAPAPREARTLVAFVRVEPAAIAARMFQQPGTALHMARRIFNALPALVDDRGQPRPYLLEGLPELDSDAWRVFPDGRMESVYRLRPDAIWHDGTPLTADDFVFSWRVYATPELGQAGTPPFHAIDDVVALDAHSFRIHWKLPYPDANSISARDREVPPLPRHILEPIFDQIPATGPDAFTGHPYWTRDYIALGPFRLDRWEPGAFIEGARFDGHVLGAPKIDRIRLRFSVDANVVLANLLAGEAQAATDNSVGQVAEAIQREWGPRNAGTVIQWPNAWRSTALQLRPELANPRAMLDSRVRKALAHAVDKQAISGAVYGGQAIFADTMIWAGSEWGDALDASIAVYPYDLRRSEQLMGEAGFAKGTDGTYAGPSEGRFTAAMTTTEGADNVPETLIMAAGYRDAGFDMRESVLPAAQAQDSQVRATFPAMFTGNTNMGEPAMLGLSSDQIPSAQNRWRGGNRGGWSNAEYDRLVEIFNRTLDRKQRQALVTQLLRIYSEDLPFIPLFFRAQPFAHVAALHGPAPAAPESAIPWNIHEWEFR